MTRKTFLHRIHAQSRMNNLLTFLQQWSNGGYDDEDILFEFQRKCIGSASTESEEGLYIYVKDMYVTSSMKSSASISTAVFLMTTTLRSTWWPWFERNKKCIFFTTIIIIDVPDKCCTQNHRKCSKCRQCSVAAIKSFSMHTSLLEMTFRRRPWKIIEICRRRTKNGSRIMTHLIVKLESTCRLFVFSVPTNGAILHQIWCR